MPIEPLAAVGRLAILGLILAGAGLLWRRGAEAWLAALLATVPVALADAALALRRRRSSRPGTSSARRRSLPSPSRQSSTALPRPAALAAAGAALGLLGLGLVQERTLRPPPYDALRGARPRGRLAAGGALYVGAGPISLSSLGSSLCAPLADRLVPPRPAALPRDRTARLRERDLRRRAGASGPDRARRLRERAARRLLVQGGILRRAGLSETPEGAAHHPERRGVVPAELALAETDRRVARGRRAPGRSGPEHVPSSA